MPSQGRLSRVLVHRLYCFREHVTFPVGAQQQVAGNASALSGLAFTSLADDDDMAQWVPNEDMHMAMTPGSVADAPQPHHEDSISLDTAFDVSPHY